MAGQVDIGCSEAFCASTWWRSKYKTCRAAFVAMGRINRQEIRNIGKDRQRIIQICRDGIDRVCPVGKKMWSMLNEEEKFAVTKFQSILGILGVSGYSGGE